MTAELRFIQALTYEDDIHIRKRLAEYKGATRFMLEVMARDENPTVRELVAKNTKTPAALLSLLAEDKAAAVRAAALQNKNFKAGADGGKATKKAPGQLKNKGPKKDRIRMAAEAKFVKMLADLAEDKAWEVRNNVARNSKSPSALLAQLSSDEDDKVRRSVALHDKVDESTLEKLISDDIVAVRAAALRHLNRIKATFCKKDRFEVEAYDEDLRARFYDDSAEDICRIVAACTQNIDAQKQYTVNESDSVTNALAENKWLHYDVAMILVNKARPYTRKRLLKNTSDTRIYYALIDSDPEMADNLLNNYTLYIKKDVQRELSKHSNEKVRANIAWVAEDKTLQLALAVDTSELVRNNLAHQDKLSEEVIEVLLATINPGILRHLLDQESCLSVSQMQMLANHESAEIRSQLAQSAGLNQTLQEQLARDESEEVRAGLVSNYSLEPEILKLLKADPSEKVQRQIRYYI